MKKATRNILEHSLARYRSELKHEEEDALHYEERLNSARAGIQHYSELIADLEADLAES